MDFGIVAAGGKAHTTTGNVIEPALTCPQVIRGKRQMRQTSIRSA
jgi:hypothetical protein